MVEIINQIYTTLGTRTSYGIILFVLLLLLFFALRGKRETFKYDKINSLFTPTERKFLKVLERAVGDEYRVYGKVRIADLVKPKKNLSKKEWGQQFWRTSSKHIDYILCSNDKVEPLLAIELNDSSHEKRDRKQRDVKVTKIFKSANFPLLWIPVSGKYDVAKLRTDIEKAIK